MGGGGGASVYLNSATKPMSNSGAHHFLLRGVAIFLIWEEGMILGKSINEQFLE